ncbi:MAG: hypothetical protein OHK0022_16990 [Roseiflexaceae bacterium]
MQPHVSRTLSVALMVFVALIMLVSARGLPVAAAPLSVINKTATPPPPPTATPTDLPTATPTDLPTATPTDLPTATPTDLPTATPTDLPTATPTRAPQPKSANPAISKQADNAEVAVGDTLSFSIFVTNREDYDAEDVVVTDNLADYFQLIDVSSTRGQVSVSGQSITVVLGSMPKGDEVLIRVRVRVAEGAPEQLSNTVSLRTSSSTNNPDDDTASATVRRVSSRIESPGTPTATAAPSAVPGSPTVTPVGAAGGAVPPARPRRLPSTGDAGGSTVALLLGLALMTIAASVLLRRSAKGGK